MEDEFLQTWVHVQSIKLNMLCKDMTPVCTFTVGHFIISKGGNTDLSRAEDFAALQTCQDSHCSVKNAPTCSAERLYADVMLFPRLSWCCVLPAATSLFVFCLSYWYRSQYQRSQWVKLNICLLIYRHSTFTVLLAGWCWNILTYIQLYFSVIHKAAEEQLLPWITEAMIYRKTTATLFPFLLHNCVINVM